ncbi:MAG: hypothetical protein KDD65_17945 [Bacteroidetes bacterium]|nr:hypothetical protein [Bacteroidota bacterium]
MAERSTQQRLRDFIAAGIAIAKQKPGLALLLYLVNGLVSLVVAMPAFFALQRALGDSGWGKDLAGSFNLPVWTDIWNVLFQADADGGVAPEIKILTTLLFFAIPLMWLWKALASVGVVNAVRDNGMRGFWSGVGRYGGRAILLALPWFLISLIAVAGVGFAMSLIASTIRTEKAVYWSFTIGMPVLSILVLALLDLMHDYGRIGIVAREEKASKAFFNGISMPFRNPGALAVYAIWFFAGLVLLVLPGFLDTWMTSGTWIGLIALIVLQQLLMVLRSGVTVGWFGSEVAYFEAVRFHDEPLIAEGELQSGVEARTGFDVSGVDASSPTGSDPAADNPKQPGNVADWRSGPGHEPIA